jgi:hypothetical protein
LNFSRERVQTEPEPICSLSIHTLDRLLTAG